MDSCATFYGLKPRGGDKYSLHKIRYHIKTMLRIGTEIV